MSTPTGVMDEDRIVLDKEHNRAIRRRSRQLLGTLLSPLRLRFALTILLVVTAQAAKALGPTLVALAIDRGLPALTAGRWGPIGLVGGAYIVAAVTTGVLTTIYIRAAARISQAILFDLRKQVFVQTQRLSLEFHESYTSGRFIARQTSDLEALRELLDSGLNNLVSGILYMVFVAVLLFLLDWRSGLILLLASVPMTMLTRWFQKRSQLVYRETRTASAHLIVHFVESMAGMRALQAFRREDASAERYGELTEDYRKATHRSMGLNGFFDPGLVLIGNVTVVATLLFDGFRVFHGTLEIGALVAALLYAKRYFGPVEQMAQFYNAFQSASAALEKVSGLLEEQPSIKRPVHPVALRNPAGRVDFDQVEFGYTPSHVILPEFNLTIPAGQTVALVGATGAGKSTLAKLITRFYDPTRGAVRLDGIDLRLLSPRDLRDGVVMVTQEAFLFSGTIAENIELGKPGASEEEIVRAAVAVGVHRFISELPDGYDTDVNKRGGRLSSGQRQLVSFARAFLANPSVLVLDEATSSLDIPSERLVQHGLQTLLAGRTALIIAHRLSTVAIADRVIVLDAGQVIEDGTPSELISAAGKFARLHEAWEESLV